MASRRKRKMVSLNQLDKVAQLEAQGWKVVPHKPITVAKLGGPILMMKHFEYPAEDEYVLVYASSTLVKPTADEVADW